MAIGQIQFPHELPAIKKYKLLGLISDTHIPARASSIPREVFEIFKDVDYIIHAGDIVDLEVIDELEQLAPVLAVSGNMDSQQVTNALPSVNSMKIMDWKIGVIHDPGSFDNINKLREIAKQNNFNVLVFGHTHTSALVWEGETLFINPGSPTNPEPPFLSKPTVALLKITREAIVPEIVQI